MNTKLILIATTLLYLNSCTEDDRAYGSRKEPALMPVSESSLPHMLAVSTKLESAFVHPDNYFDWLIEHKPMNLYIGHVSLVNYKGEAFAITAPHVRTNLKNFHSFPSSDLIEQWTLAPRGHEACFAKLLEWHNFGFTRPPLEVVSPQFDKLAYMKVTCFKQGIGVEHLYIAGVLAELSLQDMKDMSVLMNTKSAIGDRMLRRAPQERMLCMFVDQEFDSILQGCSGSVIWQDNSPVGLFVAKFCVPEYPPLLLIEPLQDVFDSITEEE